MDPLACCRGRDDNSNLRMLRGGSGHRFKFGFATSLHGSEKLVMLRERLLMLRGGWSAVGFLLPHSNTPSESLLFFFALTIGAFGHPLSFVALTFHASFPISILGQWP
jgi:hypothetical protein